MPANTRPLLNWNIVQLEAEFERATAASDAVALRRLANELQFRETTRAKALRKKLDGGGAPKVNAHRETEATAVPGPENAPEPPWAPHESVCADEQQTTEHITIVPTPPPQRELAPPRPPRVESPRRPPESPFRRSDLPVPKRLEANEARQLLRAWIALEVLAPPQVFRKPADLADGDARRIANLSAPGPLPWERGEPSRPFFFFTTTVHG